MESPVKEASSPFYGETLCSSKVRTTGKQCTNYAYYNNNGLFLCGVHSKKGTRTTLIRNPNAKQHKEQILREMYAEIDDVAKNNDGPGHVTVSKMHMIKNPEYRTGYLNVFPNYRHNHRKDGYGCSELSPKSLGPVEHNMPGLPVAINIENFHQYAKFWSFELDDNDMPTKEALCYRIKGYKSNIPERHKHSKEVLVKYGNINVPKYSLYYRSDGTPLKYSYLECRYFYCHYYELLATQTKSYIELLDKIEKGYNLNIVGYDGYPPIGHMDMYLDTSKPYGHEMVLYALLTISDASSYHGIFIRKNMKTYTNYE